MTAETIDCFYCNEAEADAGEHDGRPICTECLKREENRDPPEESYDDRLESWCRMYDPTHPANRESRELKR